MLGTKVIEKKSYAPLIINDGGRSESEFAKIERNDCTVRAYAIACNLSYVEAHKELREKAGRKLGKGAHFYRLAQLTQERLEPMTLSMTRVKSPSQRYEDYGDGYSCSGYTYESRVTTLGRFIADNPKGRFIVRVERHVMAIIDGVCHDTNWYGKRKIVHSAWRVK